MDNQQREAKLLEFIETCEFDALENVDRLWVLEHLTEEEYRLQREIIVASRAMPPIGIVAPLKLKKKARVVPFVLTAVTSAAAAVIVMMVLFKPEAVNHIEISWGKSTPTTDTVFVEQVKIDTIIKAVYLPVHTDVPQLTATYPDPLPEFSTVKGPKVSLRSSDLVNSGANFSEDTNAERFRPARFVGL